MERNLLAGIPEQLTRVVQLPNEQGHNAVWDFRRSPQGRYFVSVCGENELPLSALLYEFDPAAGSVRLIADISKCWIVDPQQMPPSKIHTSIDFLPDGRLIMATHNTSPAPGHKLWLFEQHYEHPWEGYPGSIVMIVDPDTNDVQVRGIPVPRESIYGGILGDDPRYYYFLGYMRGHFYRLDLEKNEVKDYGKVTEFASCRLVKDARGRIYGGTYTGELWRYDPETDAVADLKIHFRSPHGTKYRRALIFALESPKGTLFLTNNVDGELLELHPDTLEVTRHGYVHLQPEQPRSPYLRHAIGGLAADENFVLYYGLETYHGADLMRLVRWDVLNGGKPENLGLIAPGGRQSHYICEMIYDEGKLHMVDVCGAYSPYILTVDVKALQSPGAETPAADIRPVEEADMHMSAAADTFMHIEAADVQTLPLHRSMPWARTPVRYLATVNGRLYGISGTDSINLFEAQAMADSPDYVACLYEDGGPLSYIGNDDLTAVVLTSNCELVVVDLRLRAIVERVSLPGDAAWLRVHCRFEDGRVLLGDGSGGLHVCDMKRGRCEPLPDATLPGAMLPDATLPGAMLPGTMLPDATLPHAADAFVLKLDERTVLFSGAADSLIRYDLEAHRAEPLPIRTPSVRGRAFHALMSGGVRLADGCIVGGTADGMLFRIAPGMRTVVSYGRLHSCGMLRGFVAVGADAAVAIYGGARDAGHVVYFSEASGFVDLGRPRVIKDNVDLVDRDTEWANIHYISCLSVSPCGSYLFVGSGESYGCVVAYRLPSVLCK